MCFGYFKLLFKKTKFLSKTKGFIRFIHFFGLLFFKPKNIEVVKTLNIFLKLILVKRKLQNCQNFITTLKPQKL